MKNVFDWTKEINSKKSPIESFTDSDWKVWDSYMVHRILSMNPGLIEIVDLAQEFPQHHKKQIYSFYKEYVPVNRRWFKYIKPKASLYNKELLEHLKSHFEVSIREVLDYILILKIEDIKSILNARGVDDKDIKKWLKKSQKK